MKTKLEILPIKRIGEELADHFLFQTCGLEKRLFINKIDNPFEMIQNYNAVHCAIVDPYTQHLNPNEKVVFAGHVATVLSTDHNSVTLLNPLDNQPITLQGTHRFKKVLAHPLALTLKDVEAINTKTFDTDAYLTTYCLNKPIRVIEQSSNTATIVNVVNKHLHKPTPFDQYIGRGSILGNPYTHITTQPTKAQDIVPTRDASITRYNEYFTNRLKQKDPLFHAELNRLATLAIKNKTLNLVCFCAPKPCHGQTIKVEVEKRILVMIKQKNTVRIH